MAGDSSSGSIQSNIVSCSENGFRVSVHPEIRTQHTEADPRSQLVALVDPHTMDSDGKEQEPFRVGCARDVRTTSRMRGGPI
eukprot:scaffold108832_cov35-Tisochrysis_lutea.AAC.1